MNRTTLLALVSFAFACAASGGAPQPGDQPAKLEHAHRLWDSLLAMEENYDPQQASFIDDGALVIVVFKSPTGGKDEGREEFDGESYKKIMLEEIPKMREQWSTVAYWNTTFEPMTSEQAVVIETDFYDSFANTVGHVRVLTGTVPGKSDWTIRGMKVTLPAEANKAPKPS